MLRDWLPEYVARYGPLSPELLRDVQALLACQTPAMGGRAEACACGFTDFYWASCHKRGCSTCPGVAQARWVAARLERMLPAQHLHCVLTLPSDLRPLVRENRRALYGLLMTSAAAAVRERALAALGGDGAGARLAFTTVLHTWNARLLEHPHVHVVLAEGGFVPARDGQPARWVQPPPGACFLPPDQALAWPTPSAIGCSSASRASAAAAACASPAAPRRSLRTSAGTRSSRACATRASTGMCMPSAS